jgi:hypothetical protein
MTIETNQYRFEFLRLPQTVKVAITYEGETLSKEFNNMNGVALWIETKIENL